MKFIIPKNYNIHPKILGVFDFFSILFTIIFILITILLLSFFNLTLIDKISITIILNLPIFLFLNFGLGKENIIYIIYYLIKYSFSPKIYVYTK